MPVVPHLKPQGFGLAVIFSPGVKFGGFILHVQAEVKPGGFLEITGIFVILGGFLFIL